MEDHSLKELIRDYKINPNDLKWFKERLAEIYDEQDRYMMNMVHANIRVDWDSLPSYQNFTKSITKANKRVEYKICAISEEKFTKAETDLILENWNKLCRMYKLENKPKLFAQWKARSQKRRAEMPEETTRRSVTAILATGLRRTLQQVYRQFISTVSYGRRGPYSPIEEVLMNICFQNYPYTITIPMLSLVMDREPRGLTKRFMLFKDANVTREGDNSPKKSERTECVHWNLNNVEQMIKGIMMHENVQNYRQLQNRAIHSSTWRSVAEELGIREERLINMWYRKVHVQLFVREDIYSPVVQNKVIKILRNSPYTMWGEVSWKRIARMLGDGYTGPFVNRLVQPLVSTYCSEYLMTDLKELCAKIKKKRKEWKKKSKRLKGLRFNSKNQLKFRKKRENEDVVEESFVVSDKENNCMQVNNTKQKIDDYYENDDGNMQVDDENELFQYVNDDIIKTEENNCMQVNITKQEIDDDENIRVDDENELFQYINDNIIKTEDNTICI